MRSQTHGVGVANVVDPAFDRGVEFGERDFSGAIFIPARVKAAGEFDHVARLDAAMRRVNDETQPGNAVRAGNDLRRRFVNGQPQGLQEWRKPVACWAVG